MIFNEELLYFLDTETGGLKSYQNGLCSITFKKFNSNYLKNMIFYPQKKIYNIEVFNINGFNFEELYSHGVSRDELIKIINILSIVNEKKQNYLVFCGWNVGFDIDFISQVFRDKKQNYPCPILSFDLMEVAKKNINKKDKRKKDDILRVENYKLITIYKYFFNDYEEEKAHTSEYDTLMVEKLYIKFKELKYI